jgi:molybdopterin-guanine dinucleotide biosynthesis protein A
MFTRVLNGWTLTNLAHVTLAVLAGGEGKRMGMPKSHLRIGNRPILQFLIESMNWPGPLLLVTAPSREHPPGAELFAREVVDPAAEGPLRGILTAVDNCQTPHLAVIPVDMLGVRRHHLQWLLDELWARPQLWGLMPRRAVENQVVVEPFPFVCRKNAAEVLTRHWAEGNRSVRSLANKEGVEVITIPKEWNLNVWINLNTPADLQAFIARHSTD